VDSSDGGWDGDSLAAVCSLCRHVSGRFLLAFTVLTNIKQYEFVVVLLLLYNLYSIHSLLCLFVFLEQAVRFWGCAERSDRG
jgi:hypothetical protein